MKAKKIVLISLIIIAVLFIGSIVTYCIDSSRIDNNQKPIFILHTDQLNDGGTTVYFGLGYQLINWKRISDNPNYVDVGIEKYFFIGIRIYAKPQVELTTVPNT